MVPLEELKGKEFAFMSEKLTGKKSAKVDVGAHLVGHQHGVFIQSSITLGETLFRNNARMKNRRDLFLTEDVYISII